MEGRWFWGGYDGFGIDVKLGRGERGKSFLEPTPTRCVRLRPAS